MIVGVPKEIKDHEYRVALPPGGVAELTRAGHRVLVETSAGLASGFADEEYATAGAEIISNRRDIFDQAEMVLKVKEPLPEEYELLREGVILFTYLHLAAAPDLAEVLLERRTTAIGYETVEMDNGNLPLLTPMSEIAGRMAVQVAAHYLEKPNGGRGRLLGGFAGVRPSNVVIVGGGTVGKSAAEIALGMGAYVTVLDKNIDQLRHLEDVLEGNLTTVASTQQSIEESIRSADVVIGAVLVAGARAPKLVTSDMVATMRPGSVIIDVAVDQGGCVETCRPTSHSNPTFVLNGVVHYCVTNMPGAVPSTSTIALANSTLPYVLRLANMGFEQAVRTSEPLARGVNCYRGFVTHPAVAEALNSPYSPLEQVLA